MNATNDSLPLGIEQVREAARKMLGSLEPAGAPRSSAETKGLLLSSRTNAGRELPEYYLVYFLLVDLLGFPHLGQWEKTAWTVPVRLHGRVYGIEHRKMGLGVFAPNLDPNATRSTAPTEQAEEDAKEIVALIRRAVIAAEQYFEWRAEQAASGTGVNIKNKSSELYARYEFFRDRFFELCAQYEKRKDERIVEKGKHDDGTEVTSVHYSAFALSREAEWAAQAAIDAFFSWTEHVFIHLAILQGRSITGEAVASLADSDWKTKFKAALDLDDLYTKKHYDKLIELRLQVRNFMAHGAFGKRGEAFQFHSGAGAVPVLLTRRRKHKYSISGKPAFRESQAIEDIGDFIQHLWSGVRAPARSYISSALPSILSFANDGTYARAMNSESAMEEFVEHLTYRFDAAADMDW